MRALKWFLLWLCVLAVAGCVPTAVPASPTPAPTVTPTYTAAPPTATVPPTPTPAPSATPTATTLPTLTPVPLLDDVSFLARPEAASVRVMSYNVNWDSIFPALDPENHELRSASRVVAFRRLLAAVQPDVVCLQEINPERDPEQVSAVLETALAPAGGQDWTAAGRRDSMIAARFPVLSAGYELAAPVFPRELAQAAALVDLPDEVYGPRDLYLICAHFKAGGNFYDIVLRQRQADVIMHQLGEALSPGGNLDLPAGTPLIVLGDFNIYDTDPAAHLQTLLTGDIDNEDQYGPDVAPDWDGTALADASPSHNAQGADFYTWRNDASPLNPGALDRIIYADSVLSVANAFVLNTEAWSDAALASAGLERDDVLLDPATGYYDHLPLVVDFEIKQP